MDSSPTADRVVTIDADELQQVLLHYAEIKAQLQDGPYRYHVDQLCQVVKIGEGDALFEYRFYRLPENVTVLEPKRG